MSFLAALQQAQALLAQKDYEKVIEITNSVLQPQVFNKEKKLAGTPKENVIALQLRCAAYLGNRDYAAALSDAEILIRALPKEFVGYYYRGRTLLNLGKMAEAKKDFNHLLNLSLTPSLKHGAYFNLGLAEYIEGHYEDSIRHYTQAIQLASSNQGKASVYSNMAIVYFRQGDMAAAWNAYKTAQQLNPDFDHAHMGLAVLHADEDQWDEAVKIWRELVDQNPIFANIDNVVQEYYRWTPPMADLVRQIAAKAAR